MGKLTRNALIVGTCLKAFSLDAQTPSRPLPDPSIYAKSNVPIMDIRAGGFLKGTLKIGPVEAFGSLGTNLMPLKSEFLHFGREQGEYEPDWRTAGISPSSVTSLSVGGNIRLGENSKVTAGYELLSGYRTKLNAGFLQQLNITEKARAEAYAGMFHQTTTIGRMANSGSGAEIGLSFERLLAPGLSLVGRVGYSHPLTQNTIWTLPTGEFTAGLGLHYNFSPEAPTFTPRERSHRAPKSPRVRTQRPPTHRQIQVPCPAHKSNYRSTSNIFNRP